MSKKPRKKDEHAALGEADEGDQEQPFLRDPYDSGMRAGKSSETLIPSDNNGGIEMGQAKKKDAPKKEPKKVSI